MIISVENKYLKISIEEKGAELRSVINKETGLEYMWSGDPAFWGKTSPILFPIVGTLMRDSYWYKNKLYILTRHGFARDSMFQTVDKTDDTVTFSLLSTPATREKYPFDFELRILYRLMANTLEVSYRVINRQKENLYFSVGAHPAFKIPLIDGTSYEDYYLQFEKIEDLKRWPISREGLIKSEPISLLNDTSVLKLTRHLFDEDALVFKHLKSEKISIKSTAHPHGLDFYFDGFPYLGIWAAKNADFVCIEPWCGIADSESHDQQLISKEGINKISENESWTRRWKITSY
ncbi:MAG TPA: aldose 1-epimerase family protein [Chryseolinea sp.]